MKLENTLKDMNVALSQLNAIEFQHDSTTGDFETKQLANLKSFHKVLNKTGLFEEEVAFLNSINVESYLGNNLILGPEIYPFVQQTLTTLKATINKVKSTLEKLITKDHPNCIYIKFSEVRDFEDLSEVSNTFQKILQLAIINPKINGEISIQGVENGSIWTKVAVGSALAAVVIGNVTWSAAVIVKLQQEGLEKEQIVRQRIIQNNHTVDVAEFYKSLSKLMVEDEALHIYNDHFKGQEHDPEQLKRIQHSIELLADELSKGAEIQPSIESSKEIIEALPDMKKLPFIESRIKKIEDKK